MIPLNLKIKLSILKSNKDFIVYTLKDDKIISYILTNDIKRYINKEYTNFKVLDILKTQIYKQLNN